MDNFSLKNILFLLATVLHALSLSANTSIDIQGTESRIDSSLQVSLITCGPGSIIYELEGHSGLRFKGESIDVVVNWGLFDFESPNFLYRFVKGETDYMAGLSPTAAFIDKYKKDGREITEQILNLAPEEANKALQLALINIKPENRVYRYNYVKDNCATRPLNLIEKAINDTILLGKAPIEAKTFRDVMKHYHSNYPWYQFGIDLALGSGIDYDINNREFAFAPVLLKQMVNDAKIGNSSSRPLVKETIIINEENPKGSTEGPTFFLLTPIFICWALFVIVCIITWFDVTQKRENKIIDTLLFSIFGISGCLIAFLVFFSEHEATSPNALILWLNPLCLIVPFFIWFKSATTLLRYYMMLNIVLICAMFIMLISIGQHINSAFIPLIFIDLIRSISYIYIHKCIYRKNIYQRRYSQSYYSRS